MSAVAFDALVGNRGLIEGLIGFEPVTRAGRLILAQQLNNELLIESDRWRTQDLALQEMGFDPGVGQVDLEPVIAANFHEGPHQSFILAPPERFPNVSCMAYLSAPAGSQLLDQADTHDITFYVETMVKAGPVTEGAETAFETIVHRRIERTTEAVNRVIRRNTTMLGTVLGQQLPPRGGIGAQAWIRGAEKGVGPRYLWHGSRLQYTFQRISSLD